MTDTIPPEWEDYEVIGDRGGYCFRIGEVRVRMMGCMPSEETFASEHFGILNVSKIMQMIKETTLPAHTAPLGEGMAFHISRVDLDDAYVTGMTIARRDEPVLGAQRDGMFFMIDGHHRISRRLRDRCSDFNVYVVPAELLGSVRVMAERSVAGGPWKEAGFHPSEMFNGTLAGERKPKNR